MLPIIIHAAENFCQHQLQLSHEPSKEESKKRTLFAYIDIESLNGEAYRVYIGCDKPLIQMITETFLGEDESDDQTLIDMLLETTNMIVGSAKVLASEMYETSMNIMTPFYLPEYSLEEILDEKKFLNIDNGKMMIALQRL